MYKRLISAVSLSLLAAACGKAAVPASAIAGTEPIPAAAEPAAMATEYDVKAAFLEEMAFTDNDVEATFLEEMAASDVPEELAGPRAERNIGDRTVLRISGSFARAPMTLTEDVVAMTGTTVVIDYTLDEGKRSTRLRVTQSAATGTPMSVVKMQNGKELASSIGDYLAMMNRTVFSQYENKEQFGAGKAVCLLGTEPIECETTASRVKIGETTAHYFHALSADGQDLSTEIADNDGKIIYKSQVIEASKGTVGLASLFSSAQQ